MPADAPRPSVEQLDLALRTYRRMLLRILLIFLGGMVLVFLLMGLDRMLAPIRAGVILGQTLATWGMMAVVLLMLVEIWVDGRVVGKALNDPMMQVVPVLGLMSVMTVIAQHAHAMGMEWSGFLGPLRPVKR